jgi:hypothetical protein
MDATLHPRAPDSYYGQWPLAFSKDQGRKWGAIAQNELGRAALSTPYRRRSR